MSQIIGKFIDTKRTTVCIAIQDGALTVLCESPNPNYTDPSPHMASVMAIRLAVLLNKARAVLTGDPVFASPEPVPLGKTERGFTDYGEDIIDLRGNEVCVRESSAAGAPCAWLFTTDPRPRKALYDAHKATWAALTPEEQAALVPDWIVYDYSGPYDAPRQVRDYSDCPEELAKLIESFMHQTWPGEKDLPPDPPPLLDADMTARVVDRLFAFAKDAGSPDNWRNDPEYIAVWGDQSQ